MMTHEPVKPRQDDREAARSLIMQIFDAKHDVDDVAELSIEAFATHAATAREEGRREGLREAAGIARQISSHWIVGMIARAIEAKEQDNGPASHD